MNLHTIRARARCAHAKADRQWYSIRNAAGEDGNAAEIVLYDEIGYWGTSASGFLDELKRVTADHINLRINSPGGEIFDGIAIYNVLKAHDATVTSYVDSLAASVASVIAMAGDEVVMQPYSQLMIHDGWGLVIGNAHDMHTMAELLDRQSDNLASIYADKAGGTVAKWRDLMRDETWYFAKEAVDAGLADRVGDGGPSPEVDDTPDDEGADERDPAMARWDLSIFNYAGREHAPTPGRLSEATPAGPAAESAEPATDPPDVPVAVGRERLGWLYA
jgi:ATP-dependent protease ClpP protease subunit